MSEVKQISAKKIDNDFSNGHDTNSRRDIELNNEYAFDSFNKTDSYMPEILKQPINVLKFETRKKTRLLVKKGTVNISLLLADIALIYTKDKLVFAIDRNSKKYSIDKTLTELEQELDHAIFFRANRQYIVSINYVKSFRSYHKVKLLLDMDIPELEEPVIISQQIAPAFKKWMNDA